MITWDPGINIRAGIAIVYGTGDCNGLTFEKRVKSLNIPDYSVRFWKQS
jgi:hypothetical protein